ncbi:hypothetical protein QBC37DRAFT_466946 [Rhypophila decipiens]|uniref:DUF6594 domain-containing protein n=1 Tax=Rhypophila decipiens TaxID=261697 RepID=A0AAN7B3U4_9PEZI|nr:hypothetical protein QBC37DRAFT_466946 [Rhypophila decipiens]
MVEVQPPGGYPRLAALISAHPETGIFRRFGQLNALNLLYLQAELTNLENELLRARESDLASGHFERLAYSRDWQTLQESVSVEAQKDGGNPAQWNIMLQVREKLNEYNQTLYLQHIITKIGPPNEQDHKFLQRWMKVPSMGNVYLLGADSDIWERQFDPAELVCLLPTKCDSIFTRFMSNRFIRWYHHLIGHLFKTPKQSDNDHTAEIYRNTVHYSQTSLTQLSKILGTVFASFLLVGSIIVLYYIQRMEMRLLVIAIFSVVFSLGLCLFTNGRVVEIFSASAA